MNEVSRVHPMKAKSHGQGPRGVRADPCLFCSCCCWVSSRAPAWRGHSSPSKKPRGKPPATPSVSGQPYNADGDPWTFDRDLAGGYEGRGGTYASSELTHSKCLMGEPCDTTNPAAEDSGGNRIAIDRVDAISNVAHAPGGWPTGGEPMPSPQPRTRRRVTMTGPKHWESW